MPARSGLVTPRPPGAWQKSQGGSHAQALVEMHTGRLTAMTRREKPAVGVAPALPRSKAEVPRGLSDARPEPPGKPSQAPSRDAQPSMVALCLEPLEPERISGLLGRPHPKKPDSEALILKRIEPKTRFVLIGLAATVFFFCLAYFGHGLTNPAGTRTAIGLIIHPVPKPAQVSLPLLQDPVGLIAIVITLLTPVLFAQQVHAIGVFNKTNERNIDYRSTSLNHYEINREVQLANSWFGFIGRPDVSLAVLALSAAASFGVDVLFRRWGLFSNWNKTDLTNDAWRSRVYAGWWANPDTHLVLAIALWSLGCYFFYFVIKQVYMGAVFAVYIQRIDKREFGVSPNMRANTDGFWGLSEMRGFMLATYSSALCHTLMIVGILIIWLPFNAFTLLTIAVVTTINAVEVIYPTRVGHVGAYQEKMHFVKHILGDAQRPSEAQAAQVETIWDRPLLPFRVRSTLTTVTISLLFPLLLAVASRLIGS